MNGLTELFMNPSATRIIQKTSSEAIGERVRDIITDACQALGCPEMAGTLEVAVAPLYHNVGQYEPAESLVTVSSLYWDLLTESAQTELIHHELAHALAFDAVGVDGLGHGSEWVAWMTALGYDSPAETCDESELVADFA